MNQPLLQQVMSLYQRFDSSLIASLEHIYHPDVVFQDPLNRVLGLENLRDYFQQMIDGLDECRFDFSEVIEQPLLSDAPETSENPVQAYQAVLFWTMHYQHRKLNNGRPLTLAGNSHLRYQGRVLYHRDYFDVGAMLYEHLPLLGFAISKVKKRLES